MHRATLGMGMMRAYTGQGHGRRLIDALVRWSRDEANLAWIDLGVFSGNVRARKLYERMGFAMIGVREDAFHLESGPVVDDVLMALRLR
jgi:RimJ/RimL family protein N-acetyltransferase